MNQCEPELTPFGSSERDQLEVEFSLKSKAKAIGVATYQLYPKLPKEYQGRLPTEEDWQRLLESALNLESSAKAQWEN